MQEGTLSLMQMAKVGLLVCLGRVEENSKKLPLSIRAGVRAFVLMASVGRAYRHFPPKDNFHICPSCSKMVSSRRACSDGAVMFLLTCSGGCGGGGASSGWPALRLGARRPHVRWCQRELCHAGTPCQPASHVVELFTCCFHGRRARHAHTVAHEVPGALSTQGSRTEST